MKKPDEMLSTISCVGGRMVKRFLFLRSKSRKASSLSQSDASDGKCSARIVFISDTHSQHLGLGELPRGDVLIHAGDFTDRRPPRLEEYKEFVDWFSAQPHPHKILISGNRDSLMDTKTTIKHDIKSSFWMKQVQDYVKGDGRIKYLEDELCEIPMPEERSLKIYGTPWTALYGKPGKGFQIPRTELTLPRKLESKIFDVQTSVIHQKKRIEKCNPMVGLKESVHGAPEKILDKTWI